MATSQKLGTAELLYECAQQIGLKPAWVTPNGMFAFSVDGQEKYVNFARSPLNTHNAISLAENKYLTRLILARNNLPNIPFAWARTTEEAKAFLDEHGTIIAKPNMGSGSRDIHIITDPAQLEGLRIGGYILEKYIPGKEFRYLILGNEVIAVHRSDYGTSVEETRPLERISFPRNEWNPELVSAALKTAQMLELKFAAIDFMIDDSGTAYILEANARPGLKWFHAPTSGPAVDVARLFLEAVL
ncbi:MAG TPA: ATP-grasp domain-containing protein [Candidatus Saccharimonadales bacterium]